VNSIVITSINSPTQAVKSFAEFNNYQVVLVGDKKTPIHWKCPGVVFISSQDSFNDKCSINKYLPYNHYCRKMLGYIWANKNNSEFIYDTDDDNIPNANWTFPNFDLECDVIHSKSHFVNIYQEFSNEKIWPRGYPLEEINQKSIYEIHKGHSRIGVWQGLANGDPDVDAIYRLTCNKNVTFKNRLPIAISENIYSPFNSQNTLFKKELFKLLYLPCTVSFRFTDILRSIVAQPIMWSLGFRLGFIGATVTQIRNPHDYMKDFIDEIPMYQNINLAYDIAKTNASNPIKGIGNKLISIYEGLAQEKIVNYDELRVLESWLIDMGD